MEFWEPLRFRHGDAVRVRIGGECIFCHREEKSVWSDRRKYANDVNGWTGVVCMGCGNPPQWHTTEGPEGHRYHVHFDEPLPPVNGRRDGKGGWWWTGDFAAVELEPLGSEKPLPSLGLLGAIKFFSLFL